MPNRLTLDSSMRPLLKWMGILGINLNKNTHDKNSKISRGRSLTFNRFYGYFMLALNVAFESNHLRFSVTKIKRTQMQGSRFWSYLIGHATWIIVNLGVHSTLLHVTSHVWNRKLRRMLYEIENNINIGVNNHRKLHRASIFAIPFIILVLTLFTFIFLPIVNV